MSQPELLRTVVAALDRLRVPYMVTGSVASSLHGQPRSTHDVDLVVSVDAASARRIVAEFAGPDYYITEEAASEAVARGGMFNLLDTRSGDKVDFWILTDEPFDVARFGRRALARASDPPVMVSSPEDTILAKLRWAALAGGSEKQVLDAIGVYEVQADRLDLPYVEGWADRLGVRELWERVKREGELP
jgi:hypothetical protein